MRNLKNLNHWIAELRDIAHKAGLTEFDNEIFNKYHFQDAFDFGWTPQEAFDEEMEHWRDDEECETKTI